MVDYWLIDMIVKLIYSLIDSLIDSFIHSFIHSLINSLIDSFIDWLIHSLIDSFIDWFIHWLIHSLIDWLIDRLIICWLIYKWLIGYFFLKKCRWVGKNKWYLGGLNEFLGVKSMKRDKKNLPFLTCPTFNFVHRSLKLWGGDSLKYTPLLVCQICLFYLADLTSDLIFDLMNRKFKHFI